MARSLTTSVTRKQTFRRNKTPLRPAKQEFMRAPGAASGSLLRIVASQHSLPKSPSVAAVV